MARIANFIDGAYLSRLTSELRGPRTDFSALARHLANDRELLRSFYYDCLPYRREGATPDEQAQFDRKHRFLTALSHQPQFEVRLGQLEFRGCTFNGKPIYVQKRVDVAQAVDLVTLAAKGLITDAVLIAGDSDFIPAVEKAKAEGVVVHLFHGPAAHRDLIHASDTRTLITLELLHLVSRTEGQPMRIGA